MILGITKVHKHFGGVKAVDGCTFSVKERTITALIGPNGAGKTTMFNIINGLITPDTGTIMFRDENITGAKPHLISRLGLSRTFQLLRIFPKLTVIENLLLAYEGKENVMDCFQKKKIRALEKKQMKEVQIILKKVGLFEKRHLLAGELSYGQQKLLDIARGLSADADLILLDEPVAGVNPVLRGKIMRLLKKFKKEGKTILIIEHDMQFIMELCDEIIVLDQGKRLATGTPRQIQKNKKVIRAYLGE